MKTIKWLGKCTGEHKKYTLFLVLTASLLTGAALLVLANINWLGKEPVQRMIITEQKGSYDLTGISDWDKLVIQLPPGEKYYPEELLTPEKVDAALPVDTLGYEKKKVDYLTQRFVVKVQDSSQVYMLTFKTSGRHALKAYINGNFAGQIGNPGTSRKTMEIGENNLVCYGSAVNGELVVILQSSQFYHYKYKGANLAELYLNKAVQGMDAGFLMESKGYFIMGGLLCAAVILLMLYLLNSGAIVVLYFSLACFSMALRECITSQVWLDIPILNGELSFVLEYVSMVLITVFLTLYLGQLLKGKFWKGAKYTVLTASALYFLFLLSGDSIFYTSVLIYYKGMLIICIICAVTGLFILARNPLVEQMVALYGIVVFYFAALSDILMYSLLPSTVTKTPIIEVAMLVFVFAQTLSLFLMNNRMVAEAKEAERKLEGEKEALESINRMKTEFLGNISHELKTPLTVISSYAQYSYKDLEEQYGTERISESSLKNNMKLIESEADRLAMMVSQILDVTRIEENHMYISCKPCQLTNIIQYTLDTYYPVFSKNGNRLTFQPYREGLCVYCDEERMIQVLVNLISNAVRHTRGGTITVETDKQEGFAAVKISDTGVGMDKVKLQHLFERYYTAAFRKEGNTGTGTDTGTGLGLYVCRHIIKEHGGEITVESEPDKGTTVTFTLPLYLQDSRSAETDTPDSQ